MEESPEKDKRFFDSGVIQKSSRNLCDPPRFPQILRAWTPAHHSFLPKFYVQVLTQVSIFKRNPSYARRIP